MSGILAKVSLKNEDEKKKLPGKQKVKEFVARKPAMLREVL